MEKGELLRIVLMSGVVMLEWYLMQPYHDPVVARLWRFLAQLYRGIAESFGRAALHAEYNYYLAAGAGI